VKEPAACITETMKLCGLSASALARAVDVHPNTVSAWVTGKARTPGAVIAYLELLAKVRSLSQWA